jgi:Ni,Fe-hydrogenase III large subunit
MRLRSILTAYERDLDEIWQRMKTLPSLLSRLERTGVVRYDQARDTGAVGMAARMAGLGRDTRKSHPFGLYLATVHPPITKRHGDVYSRTQIRFEEIKQSMEAIRQWLSLPLPTRSEKIGLGKPAPGKLGVSLVEGWRGEICHCAVTDENGDLLVYKIKDPSLHNWLALALSVRENEISDFPVNNKSFNLSYCGFDL